MACISVQITISCLRRPAIAAIAPSRTRRRGPRASVHAAQRRGSRSKSTGPHTWPTPSRRCECRSSSKDTGEPASGSLGGSSSSSSSGDKAAEARISTGTSSSGSNSPTSTTSGHQATPSFQDGINWFCYCMLGLLFLTDFTPLGGALARAPGPLAPVALAAFQGGAMLLPTLAWAARRGFDPVATFGLAAPPGTGKWAAAGLALGPAVWAATYAAVALRTGGAWPWDAAATAAAAAAAATGGGGGGDVMGAMVAAAAASPAKAAALLAAGAGAPALVEELLFRGLLLGALRARFGAVDAVAVCGALFAAAHLSPEQFFPLAVLGFAAGGAAVAARSVWPAVALHVAYNATGLAIGIAAVYAAGVGAQ